MTILEEIISRFGSLSKQKEARASWIKFLKEKNIESEILDAIKEGASGERIYEVVTSLYGLEVKKNNFLSYLTKLRKELRKKDEPGLTPADTAEAAPAV